MDNHYVLTGSEDTNLRVWKAHSDKKVGLVSQRERNKRNYNKKLIHRFRFNKEIKKIKKTHLPKYILTAKKNKHIQTLKKHRINQNKKINN